MRSLTADLNCWIAPGFDVRQRFEKMKAQLNANGGAIDQSYFYLDHESALGWCQASNAQGYLFSGGMDAAVLDWMANTISFHLQGSEFDKEHIRLISLGSGEAKTEIQLMGALQNKLPVFVHIFLLDASPMLLQIGYGNVTDLFAWKKGVLATAIQGDFQSLHELPLLFDRSQESPRQLRVGCLLGFTIGNLANELYFAQDALTVFETGDLLIVDISIASAPADQPEEVRKKDIRFGNYPWKEPWERWVRGPLERYRRGVKKIEINTFLENQRCQIPGSYNIVIQATVDDSAEFTLMRIHRYEPNEFIQAFGRLGWKSLGGRSFGNNQQFVCILQRE